MMFIDLNGKILNSESVQNAVGYYHSMNALYLTRAATMVEQCIDRGLLNPEDVESVALLWSAKR
jgi:hypothetical protein